MAQTLSSSTLVNPACIPHNPKLQLSKSIKQWPTSSSSRFCKGIRHRGSRMRAEALPDWPLMAVIVEHVDGQRDLITHKSIWHLSDDAMKKDPFYDSESYRGDGGDGTGHWVYEKQEDMEESARAELWREELIEEIEQKVGGLRELEEAGKKEELVK